MNTQRLRYELDRPGRDGHGDKGGKNERHGNADAFRFKARDVANDPDPGGDEEKREVREENPARGADEIDQVVLHEEGEKKVPSTDPGTGMPVSIASASPAS